MNKKITDKHLLFLLYKLICFKKLEENRLEKDILDSAKLNRRGLTKEEVICEGYDIYPKTKITAKELIKYAFENKYIEKTNEEYILTLKGYKKAIQILTDDYSDDYFEYKINVEEAVHRRRYPTPSELTIAQLYARKKDPKIYAKELEESKVNIATGKYLKDLLVRNNIDYEDKFILNIRPVLYVANELMNSNVTLEIKGLDMPKNINISNPYPNKKYYVVGQKFKDLKSNCGLFYELDFDNIKNKKITLLWTVQSDINTIVVEHNLYISFKHTKDYGSMFSTNQFFNYDSNYLNKINLVTNISDLKSDFWGERIMDIKYKGNKIIINEYTELINFPIKLQGNLYSEEGFNEVYNNLDKK